VEQTKKIKNQEWDKKPEEHITFALGEHIFTSNGPNHDDIRDKKKHRRNKLHLHVENK
jgi:hypothetical protein